MNTFTESWLVGIEGQEQGQHLNDNMANEAKMESWLSNTVWFLLSKSRLERLWLNLRAKNVISTLSLIY